MPLIGVSRLSAALPGEAPRGLRRGASVRPVSPRYGLRGTLGRFSLQTFTKGCPAGAGACGVRCEAERSDAMRSAAVPGQEAGESSDWLSDARSASSCSSSSFLSFSSASHLAIFTSRTISA